MKWKSLPSFSDPKVNRVAGRVWVDLSRRLGDQTRDESWWTDGWLAYCIVVGRHERDRVALRSISSSLRRPGSLNHICS